MLKSSRCKVDLKDRHGYTVFLKVQNHVLNTAEFLRNCLLQPLMLAAEGGHVEAIVALLGGGANINVTNTAGMLRLMFT